LGGTEQQRKSRSGTISTQSKRAASWQTLGAEAALICLQFYTGELGRAGGVHSTICIGREAVTWRSTLRQHAGYDVILEQSILYVLSLCLLIRKEKNAFYLFSSGWRLFSPFVARPRLWCLVFLGFDAYLVERVEGKSRRISLMSF